MKKSNKVVKNGDTRNMNELKEENGILKERIAILERQLKQIEEDNKIKDAKIADLERQLSKVKPKPVEEGNELKDSNTLKHPSRFSFLETTEGEKDTKTSKDPITVDEVRVLRDPPPQEQPNVDVEIPEPRIKIDKLFPKSDENRDVNSTVEDNPETRVQPENINTNALSNEPVAAENSYDLHVDPIPTPRHDLFLREAGFLKTNEGEFGPEAANVNPMTPDNVRQKLAKRFMKRNDGTLNRKEIPEVIMSRPENVERSRGSDTISHDSANNGQVNISETKQENEPNMKDNEWCRQQIKHWDSKNSSFFSKRFTAIFENERRSNEEIDGVLEGMDKLGNEFANLLKKFQLRWSGSENKLNKHLLELERVAMTKIRTFYLTCTLLLRVEKQKLLATDAEKEGNMRMIKQVSKETFHVIETNAKCVLSIRDEVVKSFDEDPRKLYQYLLSERHETLDQVPRRLSRNEEIVEICLLMVQFYGGKLGNDKEKSREFEKRAIDVFFKIGVDLQVDENLTILKLVLDSHCRNTLNCSEDRFSSAIASMKINLMTGNDFELLNYSKYCAVMLHDLQQFELSNYVLVLVEKAFMWIRDPQGTMKSDLNRCTAARKRNEYYLSMNVKESEKSIGDENIEEIFQGIGLVKIHEFVGDEHARMKKYTKANRSWIEAIRELKKLQSESEETETETKKWMERLLNKIRNPSKVVPKKKKPLDPQFLSTIWCFLFEKQSKDEIKKGEFVAMVRKVLLTRLDLEMVKIDGSRKITTNKCQQCLKDNGVSVWCEICSVVSYCSKQCQKKHWEFHSRWCKIANTYCRMCGKIQDTHRCLGCKIVQYCSKMCQRGDWKNHKSFCLRNRPRKNRKKKKNGK